MKKVLLLTSLLLAAVACDRGPALFKAKDFDAEKDGVKIGLYTLRNGDITVQVTNFGARVASLFAPDKEGKLENIVVGHNNIQDYLTPPGERFLGACVGPVANRLGDAKFVLDGVTYNTPVNDHDANTLHGGFLGIDMLPWNVVSVCDSAIVLELCHPDMLEGYPGNLNLSLIYTVTKDNALRLDFSAVTDKPTPVNVTHHPFFCLRGEGNGSVEDYEMCIHASSFVPIDEESIPTGEILPVEGTPFDFREPHLIGERIGEDDDQLRNGNGYDHNWCIDCKGEGVEELCWVRDPLSGRVVTVLSDQIGLQFYSGNFFAGTENGSNGKPLGFRSSLALEAQAWPDTPNNPQFGDITLRPGGLYTQTTIYKFSVR